MIFTTITKIICIVKWRFYRSKQVFLKIFNPNKKGRSIRETAKLVKKSTRTILKIKKAMNIAA